MDKIYTVAHYLGPWSPLGAFPAGALCGILLGVVVVSGVCWWYS